MWEALPVAQRDLQAAPLTRRLLTAGIDAACILSVIAAALAAALAWGWRTEADAGRLAPLRRWNEWAQSPLWRFAAFAGAVGLRNWRSPGMRVMHLRRVDARTGGPVGVRSALTHHLAEQASGAVVTRWLTTWHQPTREPTEILRDDVSAAQRAHRHDPEARHQAVMDVYAAAGVNPSAGRWQPMLPVAVEVAFMLASPRHQSLEEWIAGIAIIGD